MDVSLIIPVQNDKINLMKTLFAVNDQSCLPSQIVIVDSSINDEVKEFVEKYIDTVCIIYHNEKKTYPGKARNIGVNLATEEWIAFLDSKTVPEKDWLQRTFHLIEAYHVDIVFGVTKFEAETSYQKTLRAATYGKIGHCTVPGTIVKKKVFEESGGFVENIRMGEDIEWRQRIEKQGFRVHRPDEPVLTYSDLPNSFFSTLKKYLISSYHSARVNIQRNVKDAYLTLALVFSAIIIPKWNYLIGGWDTNPLYIPNVTKIYLLSIIAILLIIQLFRWFFSRNETEIIFSLSLKIIVFFFVTLGIYRWNAVVAGWMEDAVLYFPHITKVYIGTILMVSILYRGILQPFKRKVELEYLFPFRWIEVGLLGLSLDIVKAPGYLIGALIGFFQFSRK